MELDKKLIKDISSYCKANDIEDVEGMVNAMLKKGYMVTLYGESPFTNNQEITEEKKSDEPKDEEKKPAKRVRKKKEEPKAEEKVNESDSVVSEEEPKEEEKQITKKRTIKIVKKSKE